MFGGCLFIGNDWGLWADQRWWAILALVIGGSALWVVVVLLREVPAWVGRVVQQLVVVVVLLLELAVLRVVVMLFGFASC